MAGVALESYRLAGSPSAGTQGVRAVTDARGHYRLLGLPKGRGDVVMLVPNDEQPYLQREIPSTTRPGSGRSRWTSSFTAASGSPAGSPTGQPGHRTGARLHYLPFLDNAHCPGLPEFRGRRAHGDQARYTTGADGSFRLVGLPGRAIVGVDSASGTYHQGAGSEAIRGMDEQGHSPTWNNPVTPGRKWPLAMEIDPARGPVAWRSTWSSTRACPSVQTKPL